MVFCELRLCVGLQRYATDSGGQFNCFIEKFLPIFSISMLYSPIRDVTEFCIHHRLYGTVTIFKIANSKVKFDSPFAVG